MNESRMSLDTGADAVSRRRQPLSFKPQSAAKLTAAYRLNDKYL